MYYPPTNPAFEGPPGERPPLIVLAHGGPTGSTSTHFDLGNQFWTSRGFAVVDVNYGGSTGYGRAYRQRLDGRWGVVDLQDCLAAADFLIARGDADGDRLVVRGGSAGGYLVMCALTFTDRFAAGTSYFGISDLVPFATGETHKFESAVRGHADRPVARGRGRSTGSAARSTSPTGWRRPCSCCRAPTTRSCRRRRPS